MFAFIVAVILMSLGFLLLQDGMFLMEGSEARFWDDLSLNGDRGAQWTAGLSLRGRDLYHRSHSCYRNHIARLETM